MIVECRYISGADVPAEIRFPGESSETRYEPLKIGVRYNVYGILFYQRRVDYLIDGGVTGPYWMPACLFSITDPCISFEFQVADLTVAEDYRWLCEGYGARFLIAYKELARSSKHFEGLIERDTDVLRDFYRHKDAAEMPREF